MMLLEGVRILDLTRLLPGAYCSLLLADLGAEVLKVEEPGKGDYFRRVEPLNGGQSIYFQHVNRNKRSITLNLKSDQGRQIFLLLARKYGVVLESFRPGVVRRLGIDYETVRKADPGVIYCSISGYGQDGPYRERAGHDGNYMALGGLLHCSGEAGGPPVHPGIPVADMAVGGFLAAFALCAALVKKQRTGEGQYLDISMLDGIVSLMNLYASEYFYDQREFRRGHNHFAGGSVANTVYETRDGRFMALSILEDKFWRNFCRAIGRPDLEDQDYLAIKPGSSVAAEVRKTMRTRTRDEWISLFEGKEVCCEPVCTIAETLSNEHVRARQMILDIDHSRLGKIRQLGNPIKAPGSVRGEHSPSPEMGQDTRDILREEGFSDREIDQLYDKKVV